MCLVLLANKLHPSYDLLLIGNRDEYYDRPTAQAAFWEEKPQLLAGRDLRAGGTWLGITRNGRVGVITNYRDPATIKETAPSRGDLISNFLSGDETPIEYLEKLDREAGRYNGFNLIIGEKDHYYWYSNRGDGVRDLSSGLYGLSNKSLNTPWPKVTKAKDSLSHLLENKSISPNDFFPVLEDHIIADDKDLPDTGVGLEWERILSPIFIQSPVYGTRCSTVLCIDPSNNVTFIERTYNSSPDNTTTVKYEFQIEN